MKIKEVKKLLAVTLAASMLTPTGAMAATAEEIPVPAAATGEIQPGENADVPDESQSEPQKMTPDEYQASHQDWVMPEGYHYVLQDGFVILDEAGKPVIEADVPDNSGETGDNEKPEQPDDTAPDDGKTPGENQEVKPEEPAKEEKDQEEKKDEAAEEEKTEQPKTNEELIARQQIVKVPEIIEDFRFWTVAKKYAFAKEDISILEEQKDTSRVVGSLVKDGVCYILEEEENGWLYVESGTVRGFVKAKQVLAGDEADAVVEAKIKEAQKEAKKNNKEYTGIADVLTEAEELIPYTENAAFLHTRSTVRQTVIEKNYALCKGDTVNIREDKGTDGRIVGKMAKGALCYILADETNDWVYVESGDVRGFVKKEYLEFDEKAAESGQEAEKTAAADKKDKQTPPTVKERVEAAGEDTFAAAQEVIKPEENKACYYTLTSVKSGVPDGEIRNSILEFASQFVGNPYVWGGTSLTEGADCSGFVQSIYAQYGYSLPRVAEDQAQSGTQIPVEDAQPGDLIFYARNGSVYHVVMYAGDGKTIEAMDTAHGITQGNVNTANAVWAVRILDDANSYGFYGSDIGEVNASASQYGQCLGTFKITHYCGGSCCNDQWAGVTATGAPLVEGDTIAVDPSVIPYGTKVIINGHIFTAADCGGAIKGNRIDVYVNDHNRANDLGVYYTDVFVVK